MTDRKYYLWLIPGVLVLGMVFALVFAFQPVFAGSETNLNSIQEAQGAAVPQAELDPACTLDTTTSLAIAHWPLDETSGSTFDNALGAAALDGTCSGDSCPSPISGTNAGGQFFIDTDDDGITVPTWLRTASVLASGSRPPRAAVETRYILAGMELRIRKAAGGWGVYPAAAQVKVWPASICVTQHMPMSAGQLVRRKSTMVNGTTWLVSGTAPIPSCTLMAVLKLLSALLHLPAILTA